MKEKQINLLVLESSSLNSLKSIINLISVKKDIFHLVILFFSSIFVFYLLPGFIGFLFLIALLVAFFNSKKDYFWLAFFFIMMTSPGNFFAETGEFSRLPSLSIASGIAFTSFEVFLIVALIKVFTLKRHSSFLLRKTFIAIFVFAVFLYVYSLLFNEISFNNFVGYFRKTLFLLIFIVVVKLISTRVELIRFLYLLLPFSYIIFLSAIYFFITGNYLVYVLNPDSLRELTLSGDIQRMGIYGGQHMLLLLNFIVSLIFTFYSHNRKRIRYFQIIALLSYISIIFSATRVWFIVFGIILVAYLFLTSRKAKILGPVLSLLIIYVGLSIFAPGLNQRLNLATDRIASVFQLGEESSESTQMVKGKTQKYILPTLERLQSKPIFGLGYSNETKEINILAGDGGNFALLGRSGLVGFLLFMSLWVGYYYLCSNYLKYTIHIPHLKRSINFLQVVMTGTLIAHFTTHQLYGFVRLNYDYFFFAIFFLLSDFIFREAKYSANKLPYVK